MKKRFEELEINGNLYSGTYYETETRSKMAWDEGHLSSLESVEIELLKVFKYNADFDNFQEITVWDTELDSSLKLKLGQY